jgi:hypothetical protein
MADIRALLDSDPAAGILAAADLREQRAKYVAENCAPPWTEGAGYVWDGQHEPVCEPYYETAEHIAAEANPAHALAAVRRWRGVVERHHLAHYYPQVTGSAASPMPRAVRVCGLCVNAGFPCPDLTETADEARAYLGEAS